MELLPELAEIGTGLIEGGGAENIFNQLFNFTSQSSLQANSFAQNNIQQLNAFGQQRAMQNASLTNQQQMQTQQLNATTQTANDLMAHQNTMQQQTFANQSALQSDQFAHQTNMQQDLFNQQNGMEQFKSTQQDSLMQQSFTNSLKSNAMGAAVNLGGNLIGSGLNYLMTSSLINQQASLQRENFDYMTGKAASAYQDAGLPSWLAYGGNANAFPHQTQQISGNNTFSSAIPGNSSALIWTGSSSQLALGAGNIPGAT